MLGLSRMPIFIPVGKPSQLPLRPEGDLRRSKCDPSLSANRDRTQRRKIHCLSARWSGRAAEVGLPLHFLISTASKTLRQKQPTRKNSPLQLAGLVIVTNPHPAKLARLGRDAGHRLTLKDDGPSSFLTSAARRCGTGCFMSVYSALSTFPSANSHGFPVRISGRADGFRIGRSLRELRGRPTKPINRLT